MAITRLEGTTTPFIYNGKVFVGTAVSNYETATIGDIAATFQFVGDISEGSTSWTGDDLSFDDWKNEAGGIIYSKKTDATYGFDIEIASLSSAQLKKWLGALDISYTFESDDNFATGTKVVGTASIPVQTLPAGVLNQEDNLALVFPKMTVSGGFTYSDNHFTLKLSFKAQEVNTINLKTAMVLYGAADVA